MSQSVESKVKFIWPSAEPGILILPSDIAATNAGLKLKVTVTECVGSEFSLTVKVFVSPSSMDIILPPSLISTPTSSLSCKEIFVVGKLSALILYAASFEVAAKLMVWFGKLSNSLLSSTAVKVITCVWSHGVPPLESVNVSCISFPTIFLSTLIRLLFIAVIVSCVKVIVITTSSVGSEFRLIFNDFSKLSGSPSISSRGSPIPSTPATSEPTAGSSTVIFLN